MLASPTSEYEEDSSLLHSSARTSGISSPAAPLRAPGTRDSGDQHHGYESVVARVASTAGVGADFQHAGLFTSTLNITMAAVGAGILTFPYAYSRSGWGLSLLWTVFFGCLNALSDATLFYFTELVHCIQQGYEAQISRERRLSNRERGVAVDDISLSPAAAGDAKEYGSFTATPPTYSTNVSSANRLTSVHLVHTWSIGFNSAVPPSRLPTVTTYEDLVLFILGPRCHKGAVLCVVVTVVGSLIGFLIVIGDVAESVLHHCHSHSVWCSRPCVVYGFSLLIAFPLSTVRRITHLGLPSLVAMLSVAVVVLAVSIRGVQHLSGELHTDTIQAVRVAPSMLFTLPICFFSFGNALQTVPIWLELHPALHSVRDGRAIVLGTTGVCFIAYACTGIFGYLQFGLDTEGDIFNNYTGGDGLVDTAKALMVLHVILAYPIILYPGRSAISKWIFRLPLDSHDDVPWRQHVLHTFGIVVFTATVAVVLPQIAVVFGLMGATTAVCLIVLYPAWMWLSPLGTLVCSVEHADGEHHSGFCWLICIEGKGYDNCGAGAVGVSPLPSPSSASDAVTGAPLPCPPRLHHRQHDQHEEQGEEEVEEEKCQHQHGSSGRPSSNNNTSCLHAYMGWTVDGGGAGRVGSSCSSVSYPWAHLQIPLRVHKSLQRTAHVCVVSSPFVAAAATVLYVLQIAGVKVD